MGTDSIEAYNLLTQARERSFALSVFGSTPDEYRREMQVSLDMLEEVIEIDPEYGDAYRQKVEFYNLLAFQTQDPEERRFYVERGKAAVFNAMEVDPDNPLNASTYAMMLRRSDDTQAAIAFYRQTLRQLPNHEGSLSGLSLALGSTLRDPQEQLELIDRLRERVPDSSFVIRQYGFALSNLGRFEQLVSLLQDQIKIRSEKQILASDLASYQSEFLGQHVAAAESLAEILEVERFIGPLRGAVGELMLAVTGSGSDRWLTVNPEARFRLALKQGDIATAEAVAREQGIPTDRAALMRAMLCFQAGDFECAIDGMYVAFPAFAPGVTQRFDIRAWELLFLVDLAIAYHFTDNEAELEKVMTAMDDLIARAPNAGHFRRGYNVPILLSLKGKTDDAIAEMRQRIELDDGAYISAFRNFSSPSFDLMRDDPAFAPLAAEYERRNREAGEEVMRILAPYLPAVEGQEEVARGAGDQ
jgi:tetratricopeptide (TPR) repeat protein